MSEKTDARIALEARAAELEITFRDNWKDETLAEKIAEAEKAAGGDTDDGETFTVICAVAGGRRRGGRRWDGGANHLHADDMTEDLRNALEGDPMFQILEPESSD